VHDGGPGRLGVHAHRVREWRNLRATREVAMTGILDTIKDWFRSGERDAKAAADGLEPVSVPAAGTGDDVETSTNAQVEGAAGQPWPENE
jgi:hypothetical protein